MKKKALSVLLSAAMTMSILAGCGGAADAPANGGTEETAEEVAEAAEEAVEEAADETEQAEEEIPTSTFGDASGTHLEMWDYDSSNNSTYLRTWYPVNVS